jgi:GH35 family endo-1,4-beta-xylanase
MTPRLASALLVAAALAAAAPARADGPDPKFYVFVCLGQSNMAGFPGIQEPDKTSADRFRVLAAVDFPRLDRTKGAWYPAVPPLCRGSTGLCPADYFGRTLVAHLPKDVTVGVVNVAIAGCKIELFHEASAGAYAKTAPGWMKNIITDYGGSPYARLVEMGKVAQKAGVIKGVLLHQGESNAGDKQWPAKVKAVYDHVLKDLDLKAEAVPLLAGEVVNADQNGVCASMNAVIAELPNKTPTAHVVSSAGCKARADHLHFTADGYRELGKRYGETMLALLGHQVAEPKPAEPGKPKEGRPAVDQKGPVLKDVYKDHFRIGTAGDIPGNYSEPELDLVKGHFNVVTPENCMKPGPVHPAEDRWSFDRPDALVKWCADHKLAVHGHTLVWHAQTNPWFFTGGDKEAVTKRMKDHITTLVGRFKGKVRSWDVVNEAINDRGDAATAKTENLRNSPWLKAVGPEYLTLAFKFVHDADPDAKLYYNDYGIEVGPKHDSSVLLLKRLLKDGAPIHGVGIQGHWRTDTVPYAAIDKSIADYAALGLKVSITELDVTIRGASGGQFGPGRPQGEVKPPSAEDLKAQADAYARLFAIFLKHKDAIERVTFWGLSDRRTWRFGQHPLLFDADNQRKPAYAAVVDALLRPNPDLGPPR